MIFFGNSNQELNNSLEHYDLFNALSLIDPNHSLCHIVQLALPLALTWKPILLLLFII